MSLVAMLQKYAEQSTETPWTSVEHARLHGRITQGRFFALHACG